MRTRTSILAAALTVGALLALANSAWAEPANGVKVNQTLCNPTPFGSVCFDLNYVRKTTTTPSGNVSYTSNGTATISQTFTSGPLAGCTFTGTSDFHTHYLLKPGETEAQEVQELGDKSFISFTRTCPSGTKYCATKLHAHRIGPDYDFQFYRFEIIGDCGP